jgi:hypothetical protein
VNQVGIKCERVGAMVRLKASVELDNNQQQELVSYVREWKTSTIKMPMKEWKISTINKPRESGGTPL